MLMLLTGGAKADLAGVNTLELFTRSLTNIYIALETCKGEGEDNTKSVAGIRGFLARYYPEGIPYWVLPVVEEHIEDVDTCDDLIYSRLSDYSHASMEFAYYYPKQPNPPTFVVSHAGFFSYYVDFEKQKSVNSGKRSRWFSTQQPRDVQF
jgi:hypothetical protein